MFESEGYIVYDPSRERYKKSKLWRCIVKTDFDLPRYYRQFITKHTGYILNAPSWGSHITVVNGEKPINIENWNKYNNKKIQFTYDPNVRYSGDTFKHKYIGKYWFLAVYSDVLNEIREDLGLIKKINSKFHLTVGTLY